MGVYHFMGLGTSPGAVTVALSYLAERYKRWDKNDEEFFATSGEIGQSGKRGDVQALVLFTTPEVREGKVLTRAYCDNRPGLAQGKSIDPMPMRAALGKLLPNILRDISGGRKKIALYWCDYDRNRPTQTFERVVRVVLAAKPPGELGKEVWVNLTGGANVLNSAFELAASLTGVPARMYYILAEGDQYVRHTTETRWVELPVVYAALSEQHLSILLELPNKPPGYRISELYSRLKAQEPQKFEHVGSPEELNLQYLVQLRAQRLAELDPVEGRVSAGPRWEVLARYYDAIPAPMGTASPFDDTLDKLAEREDWFHHDDDILLE